MIKDALKEWIVGLGHPGKVKIKKLRCLEDGWENTSWQTLGKFSKYWQIHGCHTWKGKGWGHHLQLNTPLTFPTIIYFKVISKAHNTESKTPYISGRILWKAFPMGPHFLQMCSLDYLTSYSQHPPPLPILLTRDLLHNPWGQSSFLFPLNPELCANFRACNHLHSFFSTFT